MDVWDGSGVTVVALTLARFPGSFFLTDLLKGWEDGAHLLKVSLILNLESYLEYCM